MLFHFSSNYHSIANEVCFHHLKMQTRPGIIIYKRSWAIFWHKYFTNNDLRHDLFSIVWCVYLKTARNRPLYDHQQHFLPRRVIEAIKQF